MGHHLTIRVDQDTIMDTDVGTWSTTPPDLNTLNLRGGGNKPQPWLQAIMFTIAKLATEQLAGQPTPGHTTITVTTRPTGWTMDTDTN